MLDSPQACIEELAAISQEIGEFGHLWAATAGELKEKEMLHQRMTLAALRGLAGRKMTVGEREAAAEAAVEQSAEGLSESIGVLAGKCEEYKTLFRSLERRSSNAQSVLSAYRDEARQ